MQIGKINETIKLYEEKKPSKKNKLGHIPGKK